MSNKEEAKIGARVVEARPNGMVLVETVDGRRVLCHVSGKTKVLFGAPFPGDEVSIGLSLYDAGRGRILGRVG